MTDEERQELEAHGPGFGLSFKGKSQILLFVLLMSIIGAVLAAGIYEHEENSKSRSDMNRADTRENTQAIKELSATVKKQGESIEAIIYVISLPQSERDKLRLREPEKLREMKR